MKPPPTNPEFARFTSALRRIVQVPKKEIQARMDAAKQARKQQHAKPASVRASRVQD
ncbi:MAG: hypothetical protein WBQ19_04780 [Terriglobales bacterium]